MSHSKGRVPTIKENPNFIGTTLSGKFDYNKEELVEGVGLASNFLPKLGSVAGTAVAPATVLTSAIGGQMAADREEAIAERKLGLKLRAMHGARAVKEKLHDWRGRWKEGAVSATTGLAGTAATIGLATAAFGGPPGWIAGLLIAGAGGIAGGYVGSKAYRQVVGQSQDVIAITGKIREAWKNNEQIPEEVIFAALAAKLPGKDGKLAGDLLKQKTGTRYFHEALEQGKIEELGELMNNKKLKQAIRWHSNMPPDISDLNRSVVSQYAELINRRQMDPNRLLRSFSQSTLNLMPPLGSSLDMGKPPFTPAMPNISNQLVR